MSIMKSLAVFGFLMAGLMQSETRSIRVSYDEVPKVSKNTTEQAFLCGMELGPEKLRGLPDVSDLDQFPEDNEALNAAWGCIFKKKGIVNENAEINQEKLEDYLWYLCTMAGTTSSCYKNAIHELAQDCSDVHGDGYGQTAVKVRNCFMHLANKRGLRR